MRYVRKSFINYCWAFYIYETKWRSPVSLDKDRGRKKYPLLFFKPVAILEHGPGSTLSEKKWIISAPGSDLAYSINRDWGNSNLHRIRATFLRCATRHAYSRNLYIIRATIDGAPPAAVAYDTFDHTHTPYLEQPWLCLRALLPFCRVAVLRLTREVMCGKGTVKGAATAIWQGFCSDKIQFSFF